MQKKYSISFIIILIFLMVFIFFVAPLSIYSYKNFEKALNKNIENYLAQVQNITQTLFEQESFILQSKAVEVATLFSAIKAENIDEDRLISEDLSEDIDLMFIKNGTSITNLSTALFDTDSIIDGIFKGRNLKGCIQNVTVENEIISVLLKSQKIINRESGKVEGSVYIGKILNENLTLLNKIVQKADIKEFSLWVDNTIIASTLQNIDKKKAIIKSFNTLDNSQNIIEKDKQIYAQLPLVCEDQLAGVKILPIVDSQVFKSLKDDYNQQVMILLMFFVIIGGAIFILMRRYIIKPMNHLLDYANHIKSSKKPYEKGVIEEYNILAKGLENIISELRDVKEQYTLAVDGTQEGLWDWNLQDNSLYFSKRCAVILGYREDEIILTQEFFAQSIHKEDYVHVNAKLVAHLKQQSEVFEDECRIKCKDETYSWIRIKAKALYDKNGRAYRMLGFFSDINEIKELEASNKQKESFIVEQSKIAAMGDMLSNIAHQWRQPLSVITTAVSGMKVQLELGMLDKDEMVKDLELIGTTSQHLSKTIDSFKDTYELEHVKESFNLNEALLKDIQILEPAYTYRNITFVVNSKNIDYYGYKDEFLLVLNKIIQNAKDAILNLKLEHGVIFIDLYKENEQVVLEISDNATGIDESIKDKIFEPYFTTKHKAQGVGLSLYVAKNIITKYFNGEIEFTNKKITYNDVCFTGASFKISFPITAK